MMPVAIGALPEYGVGPENQQLANGNVYGTYDTSIKHSYVPDCLT